MTSLFPKWTNKLPTVLALGAAAAGLTVVFVVNYWFSPHHTDVGYAPFQPIAYSHKLHAGTLGMDCRYCHRMVEDGPHATVPDAATCMGCHLQVKKESEALAPLREAYGDGAGNRNPIEWIKVHMLPEYAYFNHAVHIRANVGCASCHGPIHEMEIVRQHQPLSMGWCLECHRDPTPHIRPAGASVTDMDWGPSEASIAAAKKLLEPQGTDKFPALNPPTHCGACHR